MPAPNQWMPRKPHKFWATTPSHVTGTPSRRVAVAFLFMKRLRYEHRSCSGGREGGRKRKRKQHLDFHLPATTIRYKRCSTIYVCYGIIHACLLLAVTIHACAITISHHASAVQDDPSCCLLSHLLVTNCAFRAFDSLIRWMLQRSCGESHCQEASSKDDGCRHQLRSHGSRTCCPPLRRWSRTRERNK